MTFFAFCAFEDEHVTVSDGVCCQKLEVSETEVGLGAPLEPEGARAPYNLGAGTWLSGSNYRGHLCMEGELSNSTTSKPSGCTNIHTITQLHEHHDFFFAFNSTSRKSEPIETQTWQTASLA